MQLLIEGQLQQFIDLRTYQTQHQLPDSFSLALFEQKSYEGLGSIDHAGTALVNLKRDLLAQLPRWKTPKEWLDHHPELQEQFYQMLVATNEQVGLRESEIEFAVAGYGDVCHVWIYHLIYAKTTRHDAQAFMAVYAQWLFDSVGLAQTIYPYSHQGEEWHIQVVIHAYGRVGLRIQRGVLVDYVMDNRLACPAEGFMVGLFTDVAAHIRESCGM
jgi:hypothetical protein